MKNLDEKLDNILSKFKEIETNLSSQKDFDSNNLIKLNKEYSELLPLVETIRDYLKNNKEIVKTNLFMVIFYFNIV